VQFLWEITQPSGLRCRAKTKPASAPHTPWERLQPRSRRRGGWHRLRRCSRL